MVARFRSELSARIDEIAASTLAQVESVNQALAEMRDRMGVLEREVTGIRRRYDDAQQTARQTIDEAIELSRQTRADAEAAREAAEMLSAVQAERPELLDRIAEAHVLVGEVRDEMTRLAQQNENLGRRLDKAVASMGDMRAAAGELRSTLESRAALEANGRDYDHGQGLR